eukprot:685847-Hanusia_phi.AAC.1
MFVCSTCDSQAHDDGLYFDGSQRGRRGEKNGEGAGMRRWKVREGAGQAKHLDSLSSLRPQLITSQSSPRSVFHVLTAHHVIQNIQCRSKRALEHVSSPQAKVAALARGDAEGGDWGSKLTGGLMISCAPSQEEVSSPTTNRRGDPGTCCAASMLSQSTSLCSSLSEEIHNVNDMSMSFMSVGMHADGMDDGLETISQGCTLMFLTKMSPPRAASRCCWFR